MQALIGTIVFLAILIGAVIYIKRRKPNAPAGAVTESVLLTEDEAAALRAAFPDKPFMANMLVPVALRDKARELQKNP